MLWGHPVERPEPHLLPRVLHQLLSGAHNRRARQPGAYMLVRSLQRLGVPAFLHDVLSGRVGPGTDVDSCTTAQDLQLLVSTFGALSAKRSFHVVPRHCIDFWRLLSISTTRRVAFSDGTFHLGGSEVCKPGSRAQSN